MTELDEYLEPVGAPDWADDPEGPDEDTRYRLDDDDEADWAIRKLAKAQAAIDAAEQTADERKALIDRWARDSTASHRSTVEFFTGLLEQYHSRLLAEDPDRKTLDLPSGRVKSRTSKAVVVIDDKDALVEWAERHDIIEWQPKILVSQVRKRAEVAAGKPIDPTTGEVVPGLAVRDENTKFTVDPS